jgi:head-tail adaptor
MTGRPILRRTDLDKRIRLQRKVPVAGLKSAGKEQWETVATVWAQLQDNLPSRAERSIDGLNVSARPAKLRMDYRSGITADMRVQLLRRENGDYAVERTMEIVAGPAELGRRDGLEMTVQDYSTAGGQP